jgi:arylsulfatase A-like enzyme
VIARVASLALAAVVASGCNRPPDVERHGAARTVVLVVVDTLRDDYVTPERMPATFAALAGVGAGARRFVDARANASWTLPSMASALTSRPVLELTAADGTLVGIPAGETTLAERFRAAGFATAAFVGNATMREANGFAQGFDRFETPAKPFDPPTDGGHLAAAAESFLREHEGRDRFVWLHLMEPHEPLVDHEGRGRVAVESRILAGRERAATEEEARTFRELYALEVRRTDEILAPFLSGLPDDAIVLLTADHGEMLGEGTAWGHGTTLYEPVLRVPFLLAAPGVERGLDERPVELLDLAPTLLARAGQPSPPGELGGVDAVALPDASRERRPRLAATWSAGPLRWSCARGARAVLAHFAPQAAAIEGSRVKLIEREPLPVGVWSYDRRADPVASAGEAPGGDWLGEVAAAFANDVGRHAPGWNALVVGAHGGEAIELASPDAGPLAIARILATSPVDVAHAPGRLRLTLRGAEPFALVAFAPEASLAPPGDGWTLGREAPPRLAPPGRALWRNPRRDARQEPQAEILEHLRALGYLR